ncbi:MAG: hypothetical protein ACXVRN_14930 [Solirubrobacteraceae bacterium]
MDKRPDGVIPAEQAAAIIAVHHPDKFVSFDGTEQQRQAFRKHVGQLSVGRAKAPRLVAPIRPRPRGVGRPKAQAARSSARSGDSGDSDPPPPAAERWRWAHTFDEAVAR